MRGGAQGNGVLGVFRHVDAMMDALRRARAREIEIRDVYTPVPNHEAEAFLSPGRSRVQLVTFTGGVLGLAGGMALAIGTSLVWNLVTGGKPVTSIIPFLVVGFEITILLGAVLTFAALSLFAGMPLKRLPGLVFTAGAVGVMIGVGVAWALSGRPQSFEELIATALVGPGVVALVAGLFVVVAMILWGRGETRAYPTSAYRPEFSEDCFGVWLGGAGDAARVLEEAGAVEVIELTEVRS
jgi:molybdopterin-containing oxidoreductase family membrane subunit